MENFWFWWQVLTVMVSATGNLLAGKKKRYGWLVTLAGSVMWIVSGVACGQVAALLNGLVFGSVYLWNWLDWRPKWKANGPWLRWVYRGCGTICCLCLILALSTANEVRG